MPNSRQKQTFSLKESRAVPRAGLSSDLFTYFNDTTSEAVVLADQLEELNNYFEIM